MDAQQMLAHCSNAARMALGDLVVPGHRLPTRYAPLKQLLVYGFPFAKNLPTAPELLAEHGGSTERPDWDSSVAEVIGLLDRLASVNPADRAWPEHPAFGKLSPRAWGVLGYKHFDHHLRQFGV